jgi:methylmalonyl-CoA mutase C-terminal domain/subunit
MKKTKVLIGLLGMDQHELGAMSVARMLRDAGMEVIYLGRFNLPPAIVEASIQEDADLIGLSCHSWEYLYYVPELLRGLKENDLDIPVMVGGSVITPRDREELLKKGVAAVFGPGASNEEIIASIQQIVGSQVG